MVAQSRRRMGACWLVGGGLLAWACAALLKESLLGFVAGSRAAPARKRSCVAMNGAADPELKARMASIKKTMKVTDAMRLVAAAKVRKSQDGVAKTRPFSDELQGMIKGLVKKLKGTGLEAELPMLRAAEKISNVGILVIASDRGLCGGYNSFIGKRLKARLEDLNNQGIVPKLILIGKKAPKALKRRCSEMKFNYTEKQGVTYFRMADDLNAKYSSEIADAARNLFISGEVDKVEVVYTKFINLLTSAPAVKTLLPLTPTGIEDPEDETFRLTTVDGKLAVEKEKVAPPKAKEIENDVIFDQPPETILNSMLPLYLNSQLLNILFESQASELASRMNAMKTATDNAGDIGKKLLMIFNKKRQAYITQEICEISAGAMATETSGAEVDKLMDIEDTPEAVTEEFLEDIEFGKTPETPLGEFMQ